MRFFLPDNCQLSSRKRANIGCSLVWMSSVFHPNVANLLWNATEMVKFLKTFKIWVFKRKWMGFSKKILIFFKITRGSKFAVECVSYGNISLKCLFRPQEVFLAKNQKTLKVGKFEKYDEEKLFFFWGNNVFIFPKLHLYQVGKT